MKRTLRSTYVLLAVLSAVSLLLAAETSVPSAAADPTDDDQAFLSDVHPESHSLSFSFHSLASIFPGAAAPIPKVIFETLCVALLANFVAVSELDTNRSRAPPLPLS